MALTKYEWLFIGPMDMLIDTDNLLYFLVIPWILYM